MTAGRHEGGWGWAGTVEQFLGAPDQRWLDDLSAHHAGLMGTRPAGSQVTAWRDEHAVMTTALRAVCVVYLPDAGELDLTEHALLAAGVQPMPAELPLAAEA